MAEARQACSPPPDSKLPRLSGTDGDEGVVTMTASSPLVLGQGLGSGSAGNNIAETPGGVEASAATRPSALTFVQRQELDQQSLIYRYLAAGAPVPAHLVVPIWKSMSAASFRHKSIPSLRRLGSSGIDYYRGGVEPEPGRCRRTDGKKWRCSRDALPGHKYCERHVHRGRGRSRKPVEASVSAAPAAIPTAIPAHAAAAVGDANAPPPPRHGFSYTGDVLARGSSSRTSGAT